jgi:hypothetical protein
MNTRPKKTTARRRTLRLKKPLADSTVTSSNCQSNTNVELVGALGGRNGAKVKLV